MNGIIGLCSAVSREYRYEWRNRGKGNDKKGVRVGWLVSTSLPLSSSSSCSFICYAVYIYIIRSNDRRQHYDRNIRMISCFRSRRLVLDIASNSSRTTSTTTTSSTEVYHQSFDDGSRFVTFLLEYDRIIICIIVIIFLSSIESSPPVSPVLRFDDIALGHWAYYTTIPRQTRNRMVLVQ